MSTATATKERPILFSGPMVRAILDGRKTQTRRIIRQPRRADGCHLVPELLQQIGVGHSCPYGVPGDRLWVRETWAANAMCNLRKPAELRGETIYYRASYDNDEHFMWRPSIHMPRWASRLTLEITGVRVERLHEISEAGAVAEGAPERLGKGFARDWFRFLWHDINGEESWLANPWVWVVEFRRVAP